MEYDYEMPSFDKIRSVYKKHGIFMNFKVEVRVTPLLWHEAERLAGGPQKGEHPRRVKSLTGVELEVARSPGREGGITGGKPSESYRGPGAPGWAGGTC